MPDDFVETPGGRRRTRKSDETSPSPTEGAEQPTKRTRSTSRKGAVNGNTNGTANGKLNGGPKGTKTAVDGWYEGADPKVDQNPHYDFGGSWGVTAMMTGFPLLMWYMWIGATYYGGHFPSEPSMSWKQFGAHLYSLAYEGAYPSFKAWTIYWTFLIFQAILYLTLPGVYSWGKPLPHAHGEQLKYYCNAVASFYTTIAAALGLHFTGVFKLYVLLDEFGPIMSVAILSGFLVSIIAYLSAFTRGAQHRMTGYHVYDFFMGAELNPRMFGWLDFKMFFEVRLPWYILFLISLSAAARQYENYGKVSPEVCFLLLAHYLYANACSKGEEMIVTTWDMYYEKWGFMLIFWNLAGVPLSYCHSTIYLANHDPAVYAWSRPAIALFFTSYLFVYWIWDSSQSQKNMYRLAERGHFQNRFVFPRLPWRFIENPEVISCDAGTIMVDGWYKYARKIHYTCDMYFAITWGLITGFGSPFPWFYSVFFAIMIVHRAWRDIQRCREKYGEAWKEYERRTPYLFIPVCCFLLPF